MKKYFAISALLILAAMGTVKLNSAPAPAPAAGMCSDCGCSGPGNDGTCPSASGKTCHCKK